MTVSKISGVPVANIAKINDVPIASVAAFSGVPVGAPPVVAEKVAVLPGTDADYFSSTDYAQFAGVETEVRVEVVFDEIQPRYIYFGSNDTGGSDGFDFGFVGNGNRMFWIGAAGTVDSDPLPFTLSIGQRILFRYRVRADRVWFSYSLDGGNTFVEHDFADSTGNYVRTGGTLGIGRRLSSSDRFFSGKIYYAALSTDMDSFTPQWEFIPSHAPGYGTGQSWPSVATGETWTGQGNARISAVNTLVYDTFTDANGTLLENHTPDIGGPWVKLEADSAVIEGNQLKADMSTIARYNYAIDAGSSDMTASFIDVDGPVTQRSYAGLMVRYVDLDNFWFWRIHNVNQNYQLYERTGAEWNERGAAGSSAGGGTNFGVTFVAEGTGITGYLSDGQSVYYSSSAHQNATLAGIQLENTGDIPRAGELYDNLKVTTITDLPQ